MSIGLLIWGKVVILSPNRNNVKERQIRIIKTLIFSSLTILYTKWPGKTPLFSNQNPSSNFSHKDTQRDPKPQPNLVPRQPSVDGLPPAALPGAKLLKKFDQNVLLPFGRLIYRHFRLDTALDTNVA